MLLRAQFPLSFRSAYGDPLGCHSPSLRWRQAPVQRALGGLRPHLRIHVSKVLTVTSSSISTARVSGVEPRQSPASSWAVTTVDDVVSHVIARIEQRRQGCGEGLDPARRSALGQYFTPAEVAAFLADLVEVRTSPIRLLDPGAGVGSLTAAVVARWSACGGGPISATAVESDPFLEAPLAKTLGELTTAHSFESTLVGADFVDWSCDRLSGFGVLDAPRFDVVVMNPPYRKIHTSSPERRRMSGVGIEVPNLYAGFVALAAKLLADDGQLVAITPRSFTNGPYFRRFRQLLSENVSLRRIHVFDARDLAFADSEVLQENVIFAGTRGHRPKSVVVSSSRSVSHPIVARTVAYTEVVRADDPDAFIRITLDDAGAEYPRAVGSLPCRLSDLDVQVSTGPVVDFRAKEYLRADAAPGTVPLVYPSHLGSGRVLWPKLGGRKPNGLVLCDETARLLMPAGTYVLVKRFSAKEERRRIVAVVVTPGDLPSELFAFENHLNVFHRSGGGLPTDLARGLALFLNTTTVDQYFRQFNGHTQVNATDLRSLRYPDSAELIALGEAGGLVLEQGGVDWAAAATISAFTGSAEVRSA